MKKRAVFTVWLIAAAVLAGCSSSDDDGTSSSSTPSGSASSSGPAGAGKKVNLILGVTGPHFAQVFQAGAEQAAKDMGSEIKAVGPTSIDPPSEAKLLEQVVTSKPDAIVIQPLPPDFFARPLKDASGAGIEVVAFQDAPKPGQGVELYVGPNYLEVGRGMADLVSDDLGPGAKGDIVIGACASGIPELDQRAVGFKQEMKAKQPGVTVKGPITTSLEPTQNLASWQSIVSANPDALSFMPVCEPDAISLTQIKTRSGAKWPLVVDDMNSVIIEGIKSGVVQTSLSLPLWQISYLATYYAVQRSAGLDQDVAGWLDLPPIPVTKENAEAVATREASLDNQKAFYEPYVQKVIDDPSAFLKQLSAANQ